MENYIGNICPYCKTEITEADTVKVCPACGIPHHENCWNENHGCTTFGCSEQNYEEQHTNPTDVCANCGAPLGDAQAFCPKCGTPKAAAPKKNICSKCGNELQDGQEFCPQCGQRAGLEMNPGVSSAINTFNANIDRTNEAQKKKPVKIVLAAVAAVVVVIIAALVLPGLMVSVEDLCEEGNYLEAYEKAESDDEKFDVLAENLVAVLSYKASDGLKNPDSFELRDAWYYAFRHDEGHIGGYVILYISGENSYGAKVSEYWAYTLNKEGVWNRLGTTDVTYDQSSDELSDTITKVVVRAGMEKGMKLSKAQVERVNTQFEAGTLYKVDALDWDDVDTSDFPVA